MKKSFFLLFLAFTSPILLFNHQTFAQGSWIQKIDFPDTAVAAPMGFVIGSKVYIGIGDNGYVNATSLTKSFWEYDPLNNTWTQKADFPGNGRTYATGFSLNGKGYIGLGASGINLKKDFWEYDPLTNSWIQKNDFGGDARIAAVSFVIDTTAFVCFGSNMSSVYNDVWAYYPSSDTWVKKVDPEGGLLARGHAIGFSINGKGYVGCGIDSNYKMMRDFWEYSPVADNWVKKVDYPGLGGVNCTAFSIGNNGYIGMGDTAFPITSMIIQSDFWQYDPISNAWMQKANFPSPASITGFHFSLDNKGYSIMGTNPSIGVNKHFWEYDPNGLPNILVEPCNESTLTIFPNPGNGDITIKYQKEIEQLTIMDIKGEIKRSYLLSSSASSLFLKTGLPTGIYFYTAIGNNGTKTTGKFVVK